ncbi:MAG: sensor histidine kinase, partial [Micromonosporaceae bacterium]
SGVVDHLLSRARRTRSRQHSVPVDDILDQQVEGWEPAFRRVHRRMVVTGQHGLVARATPGGVTQVISTLVENALVHGKGTVTLKAERIGGSIVVEVSDEGAGVPEEIAPQIFERQVSGGGDGLGVGLAIARDLAEGDGGRLELVRNRPPAFAVFLLPDDPDDPAGKPED